MTKILGKKNIAFNKKARMLYELSTSYEAGIMLLGPEVKSIRAGKVNFVDSFIDIQDEAYILGLHISPYEQSGYTVCEPTRKRKLLLHSKEIISLRKKIDIKGLTIIPISLYLKNGLIKLEIAIGKGKKLHDHRASLKERAVNRDIARELSDR